MSIDEKGELLPMVSPEVRQIEFGILEALAGYIAEAKVVYVPPLAIITISEMHDFVLDILETLNASSLKTSVQFDEKNLQIIIGPAYAIRDYLEVGNDSN